MGALMQLQMKAPHDEYLTHPPQRTLFPDSRTQYSRHGAFAIENSVGVEFPVPPRFGGTVRVNIPTVGDLLSDVVLELRLPALPWLGGHWVRNIGYVILRRARLFVNETLLHDQERLWYDIYDKMFCSEAHLAGLHELLAADRDLPTGQPHSLLVPLKFMCCAPGTRRQQYLPLIALPGASVQVELEFEALRACVVSAQPVPENQAPPHLPDTRLRCDYVWLSQRERAALMASPVDIMFDTQLDMEESNATAEGGTVSRVFVDLREINHPVRALAVVAYRDDGRNSNVDFKYLDVVRGATLLLGHIERFQQQDGGYFRLVQPLQRGVRARGNVYVYSFALDMDLWQPTGAANFSVMDKPVLRVDLADDGGGPVKVKVFAMCMSWVRFSQGQAALLFT
jgi:hypothetical protein